MTPGQGLSLALLVHIGYQATFGVEQYLCVILEIHLDDFVAKAEHDCMLSAHPLLHIDMRVHLKVLISTIPRVDRRRKARCGGRKLPGVSILGIFVGLKVRSEMLHQCHLLVEVLRIVSDFVHLHDILLLSD